MTIEQIRLERGECEGTCPAYSVEVRSDLTAIWDGRRFVVPVGTRRGRVAEETFHSLAALAHEVGFFGWREEYFEPVTCHPMYSLEVSADGTTKRVRQYATEEPAGFGKLAGAIDRIARSCGWVARADGQTGPSAWMTFAPGGRPEPPTSGIVEIREGGHTFTITYDIR